MLASEFNSFDENIKKIVDALVKYIQNGVTGFKQSDVCRTMSFKSLGNNKYLYEWKEQTSVLSIELDMSWYPEKRYKVRME